ncbi:MAG: protein-disulfide reductase DsbD family protein [SAR86 cluster bacterium]|nr:protein-disulfide reductase DsbD family protein [SAR86 cluster bacterium]
MVKYKNSIKLFLLFCASIISTDAFSETIVDASDSRIEMLAESNSMKPGDGLLVGFKFTLNPGWHTYWENPGDAGEGASIKWNLPNDVKASEILWPGPERIPVEPLMTFGYENEVVLLTKIYTSETTTIPVTLNARVSWYTCKEICIPQEAEVSIPINLGNKTSSTSKDLLEQTLEQIPEQFNGIYRVRKLDDSYVLQGELENMDQYDSMYFFPKYYGLTNYTENQFYEINKDSFSLQIKASEIEIENKSFEGVVAVNKNEEITFIEIDYPLVTKDTSQEFNILTLIVFAFLGGLILNVMPCVFPILSIKILRFVEQSRDSTYKTLQQGLLFSLGVIFSFLTIAALLIALKSGGESIGWGYQLQSPVVVSLLFYLFVVLGFIFMSNIVLGSGLARLSSISLNKSDSLESFLTGVLAVIVASPCTAPFMGSAIGFALLQPSFYSILIFLGLGIGFSLPYLILSAKPSLLSFLPKPGQWMETFKQFMAFPMWASALWLLWVLSSQVNNQEVIQVLLGALLITTGLWLIEKNNSERDWVRWLMRLPFLLLFIFSLWLIPTSYSDLDESKQDQLAYTPQLLKDLREKNSLVFLNFTADWCITCKVNEAVALKTSKVSKLIADKNITYMEADWTRKDPIISSTLEQYGRTGLPLYLLFPSKGDPLILPEILTEDILLSYLTEVH